uniref:Programmed cell death protein 7-like n=1 Tax=Phallusia mammillata TaxID=59560 RepID=A0A6F9DNL3_9ASCI|nr:programmed cell death protein 7-like [Phallusia mammillata]
MNPYHSGGPPNWVRHSPEFRPPHFTPNQNFPNSHPHEAMQHPTQQQMVFGGPGPPNPGYGNLPFNANENRPRYPRFGPGQINTGVPAFGPRSQSMNQQINWNPNMRPEFRMDQPPSGRFPMFLGPDQNIRNFGPPRIQAWNSRPPFHDTGSYNLQRPHNRPVRPQLQSNSQLQNFSAVSNASKNNDLVTSFLSSIGKLPKSVKSQPKKTIPNSAKQSITISEAQQMLSRANVLIKMLEETSESSCDSTQKIKDELIKILSVMKDPKVVKRLETRIKQRRKSRMRKKLKRRKAFEQMQEEKQRIEEKNKKIEEWQKQENVKLDQQLREAEMQKQIDEALVEVRKEQAATSKAIERISFLAKLRKIRFNARKIRGEELPDDSVNNNFEQTVKKIKGDLQMHKASCEEKAASLRLFMEAEQKEAKLAIENKRRKKEAERQANWKKERETILFGKSVEVDAFDPMWPIQELHKQANLTFNNLVQYRQMWDQFLDQSGTSLPIDWVEPVQPSSFEWKNMLESSTVPSED